MNDNNSNSRKEYQRVYQHNNRADNGKKVRDQVRNSRQKARTRALAVLGNKCVRCGFDNWKALQIDHREGGGSQARKIGGAITVFYDVPKHPELYQLLCANCNWIKRVDNKEYPQRMDE